MSHPQIIRTITELEALDPDTLITSSEASFSGPAVMQRADWVNDYQIDPTGIFPLAVIATGDAVREARKALEEA
ncbi:hypothetical protein [Corynebacterium sp. A21]|uniref:hypothetical protein n=1 Tax=Corynebacterium sp. A21 TaxID=3457318 RepID=UPI003FD382B4